jgi:Na+/H+ antiporter NhaC
MNLCRPITDSFFVSREKLAFIVDANCVAVPSISPVSSWIGALVIANGS